MCRARLSSATARKILQDPAQRTRRATRHATASARISVGDGSHDLSSIQTQKMLAETIPILGTSLDGEQPSLCIAARPQTTHDPECAQSMPENGDDFRLWNIEGESRTILSTASPNFLSRTPRQPKVTLSKGSLSTACAPRPSSKTPLDEKKITNDTTVDNDSSVVLVEGSKGSLSTVCAPRPSSKTPPDEKQAANEITIDINSSVVLAEGRISHQGTMSEGQDRTTARARTPNSDGRAANRHQRHHIDYLQQLFNNVGHCFTQEDTLEDVKPVEREKIFATVKSILATKDGDMLAVLQGLLESARDIKLTSRDLPPSVERDRVNTQYASIREKISAINIATLPSFRGILVSGKYPGLIRWRLQLKNTLDSEGNLIDKYYQIRLASLLRQTYLKTFGEADQEGSLRLRKSRHSKDLKDSVPLRALTVPSRACSTSETWSAQKYKNLLEKKMYMSGSVVEQLKAIHSYLRLGAKSPDPDVIFASVDFEGTPEKPTEMGICLLDTRLLARSAHTHEDPFQTLHYYWRRGSPKMFPFGHSFRIVSPLDNPAAMKYWLKKSFSHEGRKVVLVIHQKNFEIHTLRYFGIALGSFGPIIDTAELMLGIFINDSAAVRTGLERICTWLCLPIERNRFHNPGVDAHYTMRLMLLLAILTRGKNASPNAWAAHVAATATKSPSPFDVALV